jgi:hypothetical protein
LKTSDHKAHFKDWKNDAQDKEKATFTIASTSTSTVPSSTNAKEERQLREELEAKVCVPWPEH